MTHFPIYDDSVLINTENRKKKNVGGENSALLPSSGSLLSFYRSKNLPMLMIFSEIVSVIKKYLLLIDRVNPEFHMIFRKQQILDSVIKSFIF